MATTQTKAAQDFVPIKEIRDGLVILKDGGLRIILMTSSLNFALKSAEEQTAIINSYQNFLNSLDFPIQIFVQSRDIDIEPYIVSLQQALEEQPNELLQLQIKEYIGFIKNLVTNTDIVTKTFYVVIPYSPTLKIASSTSGGFSGIFEKFLKPKPQAKKEEDSDKKFVEHKIQLQQRADAITHGLSSLGIHLVPLNTEELIELFYGLFNPGELEKSKLPKPSAADETPIVTKQ